MRNGELIVTEELVGTLNLNEILNGAVETAINPDYALKAEAAAKIELHINNDDYKMYAVLKDKSGNAFFTSNIIDLPLESMVVNGRYDENTKKLILTLDNGNEIEIPLGALISGLQNEITPENMLSSDLVDDVNHTHKFVTAENISDWEETKDSVLGEDIINNDVQSDILFFNDTQENAPLHLDLYGNVDQYTTTGKNLLNFSLPFSVSGEQNKFITPVPQLTVGQNYYFVGKCSDGTKLSASNCVFIWYDSLTSHVVKQVNANITYTAEDLSSANSFYIYLGSNLAGKTITECMLVKGNYDSSNIPDYEPYTNGISPNPLYPQDINSVSGDNIIKIEGKNRFNNTLPGNIKTVNCTVSYEDGQIALTATGADMRFGEVVNAGAAWQETDGELIAVKPSTKYSIKISNNTINKNFITYYNKDRISIGTGNLFNSFGTFTTLADAKYIGLRIGYGSAITDTKYKFNIMLVEGEYTSQTMPEYELYQGEKYHIDLPVENLFDYSQVPSISQYEKGVKLNKTSYRTVHILLPQALKPNTQYTISGIIDSNTVNNTTTLRYIASSTGTEVNIYSISSLSTGTFTSTFTTNTDVPDSSAQLYFYISSSANENTEIKINNLQIEKGDNANHYTPYGITALKMLSINNYKDTFIKNIGKNLLTLNALSNETRNGVTKTISGSKIYLNGTTTGGNDIVLTSDLGIKLSKGTYSFSLFASGTITLPSGKNTVVILKDFNGTSLASGTLGAIKSKGIAGQVFSLNEDTELYLQIYSNGSGQIFDCDLYCQIEEGSISTVYEPYGKNEWYVKKAFEKIIINSATSENVSASSMSGTEKEEKWAFSYKTLNPNQSLYNQMQSTYVNVKANKFTLVSQTSELDVSTGTCLSTYGHADWFELRFRIPTAKYTKQEAIDFINGTEVYYPCAPKYIKITDKLFDQLNALEKAVSYKTQTNISQINNDLPFLLEAHGYTDNMSGRVAALEDIAQDQKNNLLDLITKFGFDKDGQDKINFAVIKGTRNGLAYDEFWLLSNARYDYETELFYSLDKTKTSFGIQIQMNGTYPGEEIIDPNNAGINVWRHAANTAASWNSFGVVNGWINHLMLDSYGGITIGGAGLEVDGNGITPYTRLSSSAYTDENNQTYYLLGLLDNAYHPTTSGTWGLDTNKTYSWFMGLRTPAATSGNISKDNTKTEFVIMYNDTPYNASNPNLLDKTKWHVLFNVNPQETIEQTDIININLNNVTQSPLSIDLKGNSEQYSASKNKFTLMNIPNNSVVGVKSDIDNSVVTLHGTTTGSGYIVGGVAKRDLGIELLAGTYTISYKIKSGSYTLPNSGDDVAFSLKKSDNTTIVSPRTLSSMVNIGTVYTNTFTLTETTHLYYDVYANRTNIVFSNCVFEIQIEQGSSATAFEQYGILTITTPQDIHVVKGDNAIIVSGKNLFDGRYTQQYVDTDGTLATSTNTALTDYIEINGNLTISAARDMYIAGVGYYDSSKTFISREQKTDRNIKSISYTTPNNVKYVRVYVNTGITNFTDIDLQSFSIQIEKGATATAYEPYTLEKYTLNLPVENLVNIEDFTRDTDPASHSEGLTIVTLDPGYYTLSWDQVDSMASNVRNTPEVKLRNGTVYTRQTDAPNINLEKGHYSWTFWIGTAAEYVICYWTHTLSTTCSYKNFQLEKGKIANAYNPYGTPAVEMRKIEDFYQDKIIKGVGKNLFNKDNGNEKKYIGINTGELSNDNQMFTSNFIKVEPNTVYGYYTIGMGSAGKINIACYDKDYNYLTYSLSNLNGFASFTTPANCEYVRCICMTQFKEITYLYKGETALSYYEPYGAKDKWLKYGEVGKLVMPGANGGWSLNQESTYVIQYVSSHNLFNPPPIDNTQKIRCTNLKYKAGNPSSTTNEDYIWCYGRAMVVNVRKTFAADLTAFKALIDEVKPVVYYPCAIPYCEFLPESVEKQLDAIKTARIHSEKTILTQTNADLPFLLDIKTFSNNSTSRIAGLENGKEDKANKVVSLNELNTDAQYPSAKCVYNNINPLQEELSKDNNCINENDIITVDNSGDSLIKDIVLKGNTSQIRYNGVNLYYMNYSDQTNGNWNGVSVKSTKTGYELKNTATATGGYTLVDRYISFPAGTYTFKLKNESAANISLSQTNYHPVVTLTPGMTSKSFTLTETTNLCLTLGITQGQSYNETNEAMVYSGTNNYNFEPYVGSTTSLVMPCPNPLYPQLVNKVQGDNIIQVCGKNLAFKELQGKYRAISASGSIVNLETYSSYKAIVKENTWYRAVACDNPNSDYSNLCFFDKDMKFLSGLAFNSGGPSRVFQTPKDCKFATVAVPNTTTQFIIIEGDTDERDYIPYAGIDYKVTLPVENLFKLPESETKNGIVYTKNENGTISLHGTASQNLSFVLYRDIQDSNLKTLEPYILFATQNLPSGVEIRFEGYNGDTWQKHLLGGVLDNTTNSWTKAIDLTNVTRVRSCIYVASGTNVDIDNLGVQVEIGNKMNTFQPYGAQIVDLCHINTTQDYFKRTEGIQLFNKTTVLRNKMAQGNGNIIDYEGIFSSDFIKVEPCTAYYVNQYAPTVIQYDKNQMVIGYARNTGAAGTFTTDTACEYIRIRAFDTTIDMETAIENTMLNKGSSAAEYEPYGKGLWVKHCEVGKITYCGASTENWQYYNGIIYIDNSNIKAYSTNPLNFFTNYFKPADGKAYIAHTTYQRLHITLSAWGLSSITTAAAWKTWLNTHPLDFYYELTTPTNELITYKPLIEQLDKIEQMRSNKNHTQIAQDNNDNSFIINAEIFKNTISGDVDGAKNEIQYLFNSIGNLEHVLTTLDIGNGV